MNKISRRNFLKVAGAGAAAMGLAACGGSSSSSSSVAASSTAANAAADTLSGTIEYWSSWSETENQALVLKQAADAFTQLHPNVKINFTFNGRDNRNLVVSAIEAGTQIDLMDANIDNVQKLWSENIKDLSSYIDKTYDTTNGKAYKDVVIPSMISLAGSLFDGKTMCIPYIPQAFMIFCNKGLLEECGVTEYPQTWEELMDACEKVKAAGHIPVTTDSNYCTSWVGYYMSRRLGNDRVMELAKDSSQWASEQGIKDTAEAIDELPDDGVLFLQDGTYPLAGRIVFKENMTFKLSDNAILLNCSQDKNPMMAYNHPYKHNKAEGNSNIIIEGGIWDMNGQLDESGTPKNLPNAESINALGIGYGSNITIRNITFRDCYNGHVIQVAGSDNVLIENCRFEGQSFRGSGDKTRELLQIEPGTVKGYPYTLVQNKAPSTKVLHFETERIYLY